MTPTEALQALTEHLPGNTELDDPVRARQREAAAVLAAVVDGVPLVSREFMVQSIESTSSDLRAIDFMDPIPGERPAVVTAESLYGETVTFNHHGKDEPRVGSVLAVTVTSTGRGG